MRVGIGQDSHRFKKGKSLVLAGKIIEDHDGLEANSDGDIIYHAICNAIGTAIGEGSLSSYADDMCTEGIADSSRYVEHIYKISKKKGYLVNNISISIECKTPKIDPHIKDFKENIAKLLRIDPSDVGIAATSGEGLTDFGKGLGMQVIVVVTLGG
jgi:2-C-methyl-D-erythritol 2,4-cyclodiphosphate synthase